MLAFGLRGVAGRGLVFWYSSALERVILKGDGLAIRCIVALVVLSAMSGPVYARGDQGCCWWQG